MKIITLLLILIHMTKVESGENKVDSMLEDLSKNVD